MKKLLAVAVVVLSCAAFAQDQAKAPAAPAQGGQAMQWKPQPVTKKDTKGLGEMWKSFGQAFMKGDVQTAAQYIDFPVLMVTDDGKGNAMAQSWDKDTWTKNMTESMKHMPHDKNMHMQMRHDHQFLANDLVFTIDTTTMAMGKKKMTLKSGSMVINKDGKWMIKSMVEGGWGGMMSAQK